MKRRNFITALTCVAILGPEDSIKVCRGGSVTLGKIKFAYLVVDKASTPIALVNDTDRDVFLSGTIAMLMFGPLPPGWEYTKRPRNADQLAVPWARFIRHI